MLNNNGHKSILYVSSELLEERVLTNLHPNLHIKLEQLSLMLEFKI